MTILTAVRRSASSGDSPTGGSSASALAGQVTTPAALTWLFSITLLVLLSNFHTALGEPDTYWHIATGRLMLDRLAIVDHDVFSYTFTGSPWQPHEWLSEVIMAAAYQAGGWSLVALLAPFATATAILLVARHLARYLTWQQVWIICLLAVITLLPHMPSRPHVLAWPLTVLWVSELVRAADDDRSPPWWLLLVLGVWTNLHGSYLLGLAIAGFIAAEVSLRSWQRLRHLVIPWRWIGFLTLASVVITLTPHGPSKFVHVITLLGQKVQMEQVIEWQSPNFHDFQPFEAWLVLFASVSLYLGIRLPATRIVILLTFVHLALKHQRFIDYIGLLVPVFLAAPLAPQLPRREDRALGFVRHIAVWLSAPPRAVAALVLALAITVAFPIFKPPQPAPSSSPDAALAAARAAGVKGPVFNEYNFGGYLISQGVPTFIDGRSELFGDTFLNDYLSALTLTKPDLLLGLLEKYGVTWSILPPDRPAVALLDRLPGWRRLYTDEKAVVHVKDQ